MRCLVIARLEYSGGTRAAVLSVELRIPTEHGRITQRA